MFFISAFIVVVIIIVLSIITPAKELYKDIEPYDEDEDNQWLENYNRLHEEYWNENFQESFINQQPIQMKTQQSLIDLLNDGPNVISLSTNRLCLLNSDYTIRRVLVEGLDRDANIITVPSKEIVMGLYNTCSECRELDTKQEIVLPTGDKLIFS